MNDFSKKLRKYMELANLNQSELCKKTGISKASMSEYLSGNYEPKQKNIYKIAMALNIKPSQLLDIPDVENSGAIKPNQNNLSEEESSLINNFRMLSQTNQLAVKTMIEALLKTEQSIYEKDDVV